MAADTEGTLTRVLEALEASGNPDKLTPDQARELTKARMAEYGLIVGQPTANKDEVVEPPEVKRTLAIPQAQVEPYWYDDPADAEFLEHFIMSRRALGGALEGGILITGPAGVGKTEGVRQAINRLNAKHGLAIGYTKMECPTVTDPQKWFGRRELDKDGTRYEKSDFIIGVERGDVILLDELPRVHPTIHNGIMTFLDGSEQVHLSDLNVTITRHPETVFLATANIGSQFGGNHRLDWAMRERFPYNIEREFPPAVHEIRILTSRTGCDPDGAARLVRIAAETRRLVGSGDLRSPISTRTLIAAAWLMASGMNEAEALSRTALPLYDKDSNGMTTSEASERTIVAGIIKGKFG